MIKVSVKNLTLTYPLISTDSYLLRARIIKKIFNFFKLKKKIDNNNYTKKTNLTALNNISFEILEGDILGLIGFNGSGKSTLLKCLANILPPTTGSIEIEGSDFLPIIQPYSMCEPGDTLVNNINLLGRILGFKKKNISEKIDEIINFAELTEYKNLALSSLSMGMKFRLVFAICFILEGKDIYFIDEFLITGDEKFQNKGFDLINKKKNKIIVVCSHSRRIIEKFCNKLLILEKGNLIYFGKTQEGIEKYNNLINN
jgi:ABC-type polysaccharide/polyol phosphate transport system ATPase subunit